MPDQNNIKKIGVFGFTGLLMGLLFISQTSSLKQATFTYSRDAQQNIFKEIQVVKQSNDLMKVEIEKLQKELSESTTQEEALESIKNETEKYSLIAGKVPAYGEGIILEISENLLAIWLTDTVHELNGAGAEIIEINGIRINSKNIGFDTMPNGQLLVNGNILKAPYIVKAIGNSNTLAGALGQPGGLIQRINEFNSSIQIRLEKVSRVEIK